MGIKILRVVTGEEIMGEVRKQNNGFRIENPMLLFHSTQNAGEGKMMLNMMPLTPHSIDSAIEIAEDKILYSFRPVRELEAQYTKFFKETPLVLVPQTPHDSRLIQG